MVKEKINLNVTRNVGDIITAVFAFGKQEFKPFIKCFCVFMLPLLILDLILKSTLLHDYFYSFDTGDYYPVPANTLFIQVANNVVSGVIYFWLLLMTLSYLRVYNDKYITGNLEEVSVSEVWKMMTRKMGLLLVWALAYFFIVVVGVAFLLVPGIYFSIALIFGSYLLVIKDWPLDQSILPFSFSKGEWWSTLGLGLLLGLIMGILITLFVAPYTIMVMASGFTDLSVNELWVSVSIFLAKFGDTFFNAFVIIGVGFKFFGMLEGQEHNTLKSRIAEMGSQTDQNTDEGDF